MDMMKKYDEKATGFMEGLSETEQQIVLSVKNAPVPTVSQDEIAAVCNAAASYYTEKQTIWNIGFWKVVFFCFTTKSAFFWIFSAFLLGSGVVISFPATSYEIEPLALMTALSPVPILAFAIRELQYRDNNLVLLEKTCKYAPAKIYFSCLWLGMILNTVLVVFAGAIIFTGYKNLLQLYLCSFIAMFFVGACALLLLSFLDNALPLSLTMAVWVLGATYLLCQPEILDVIRKASMTAFIGGLVFSFALFVAATIKSTAKLYA